MLYKKNSEKELSTDTFLAPGSEYRGTPFWSWNCKMTSEILEKQIDYLKDMGFGGFHMHSRSGMDNAYLSDEFMGLVRACTDKAKREGMLAWLYDEDRWPSGAAGGLVTRDPEYRARNLYIAPSNTVKTAREEDNRNLSSSVLYDMSAELPKREAIKAGKPYYIATYDITLDENGYLKDYKKIKRGQTASGESWIVFSATPGMSDWYNGYCYIDTMSVAAVKRFIEVTHERYRECVGDEFDKTVPAIFTDEPQFGHKTTIARPTDKTICSLPWTPDFPTTYKKAYGSDIIDHIPELIWDLPDDRISVSRYRYHDHICQRFTEAFSRECGKWCDKHSLPLTGHMMDEPTLSSQTKSIGEAMRAYKYFGYPGIDMLCNKVELTTAKQTQSVVHQWGKEGMLSELYGVTNWDFDFRGHKFQGDWQAALGVTIRVPHLSWVSMKGDAKRDYPASINYQSPWYKEYKYVEDHFARLNTALTRGVPEVSIGVIHPIESYWLHWGPGATTLAKREQLDTNFRNLIEWLLFSELDFDYISESMFPDACPKALNPIKVGKMKYDVIVVPALETIRKTTVDRLRAFAEAGGRVIFMGDCPRYVDCKEDRCIAELYASCERVPFEKYAIVRALEENRKLEIRTESGNYTDNYIYQLRRDGKYKWLFVANARKSYTHKDHTSVGSVDVSMPKKITFKVKGLYLPKLYDTVSGEIKDVAYTHSGGCTVFSFNSYVHDSFLIRLEKTKKSSLSVQQKSYKKIGAVDFKKKVSYTREEPNVLLLDIAEWKWDNESSYQPPEEIRRLDGMLRRSAGIPRKSGKQPWCLPEEKAEHTSTLRFTFNSEIELDGAEFACEDMDASRIVFDGEEIERHITGYFTDECIKKTAIPRIGIGKHTIELTLPLASRTYTENCFLLGEFNVRLEGTESTLVPPTDRIGFGSVTGQGMPFYGGNLTYTLDINVPLGVSAMKIHASHYRGALISAAIDGKECGKIVYQPYDLIVSDITPGKHTLSLTLFGNRHNSFGALHNADNGFVYFSPASWSPRDDAFSYEYHLKDTGILRSPIIEFLE